jgi:cytochrome c biogenesis protein CcmG, thiol:disulfide interchange protein DsbE
VSWTLPVSLVALLLLPACASRRPGPRPPAPAGLPLELVAQDLSGREVRLPASRGRVLVVDFFASWCEPCRAQFPRLDRLARELRAEGLDVVGVSFDEEREAAQGFAAQTGVSFPVLWDRGGDRLAAPLRIERLPTTLLVDRGGTVRGVHLCYDVRGGDRLEQEVRALLRQR